jgi:predicted secreted hydrolase
LTFFRHAVDADKRKQTPNVWDVNDVWLAHFAVSDIEGGKFHHAERMNRSGAGQAGVDGSSARVWNGNWQVQWSLDEAKPARFAQKQLTAIATGFRVDLQFRSDKPPVVHGRNGVSQKSAGAGRASHYVSLTRLITNGVIEVQGRRYEVQGQSWMDHEFFTHSLEANQSGWDWFSLQLDDGSELMLYRLRRKDGSIEPFSSGTYIAADGRTTHLAVNDYILEPSRAAADQWTSPQTRGTYPLRWTLTVPSLGIQATTSTRLRQQEIVGRGGVTPNYWEGAIEVKGTRDGRPLTGSGYLEMTGYAGVVEMGGN